MYELHNKFYKLHIGELNVNGHIICVEVGAYINRVHFVVAPETRS